MSEDGAGVEAFLRGEDRLSSVFLSFCLLQVSFAL